MAIPNMWIVFAGGKRVPNPAYASYMSPAAVEARRVEASKKQDVINQTIKEAMN
jgi:hypothetical protein